MLLLLLLLISILILPPAMGLSRRRVAQGTAVDSSSSSLHAGSAFERGTRVACDPRDTVAEGKMPKLTIMEQVLLLGLKDKQVGVPNPLSSSLTKKKRAIYPSGMTIFRMLSVVVC